MMSKPPNEIGLYSHMYMSLDPDQKSPSWQKKSRRDASYLSIKQNFLSLIILSSITRPLAASGMGEWYHECNDGNCDYGSRGNAAFSSSKCRDDNGQCATYARLGECFASPGYMNINCRRSCGICQDNENDWDQEDDSCFDKHSNCKRWSDEMECYANPAYMSGACPASCGLCLNPKDLRKQGFTEDEIRLKQKFTETDLGLWQSIPKDSSEDTVRMRIKEMGLYIRKLHQENRLGRGTACNNQYHDCAKWSTDTSTNCESNINFMISYCSLVCKYCHVVEQYHTCRQQKRTESIEPFHDVDSVRRHLMTNLKDASDLLEGSCSADNPTQDGNVAEWIVSLKWSDLWGTEAEVSSTTADLMQMLTADEMEWVDAVDHNDIAAMTFDGTNPPDRSGQILTASHQMNEKAPYQALVARISNTLNVPQQNLEVEFVRYQRGERHASHADYRLHDTWKSSGIRVLSLYLVLQRADKGGNFGFPFLNWLLVENPEILVWPNIHVDGESVKPILTIQSEQLPVVEGELYAAHVWVHEYSIGSDETC
ncbi:ShK domain-like protein [Nitzschia inconspicua]|uniref:ShK domain-like protein n=1 Tax=Nitzschia inconspicua TaxID=303405 RepID=A0A9K3KNF8_9STRA|nr:ShK domain-like protein [Nitzschia inconspicua]